MKHIVFGVLSATLLFSIYGCRDNQSDMQDRVFVNELNMDVRMKVYSEYGVNNIDTLLSPGASYIETIRYLQDDIITYPSDIIHSDSICFFFIEQKKFITFKSCDIEENLSPYNFRSFVRVNNPSSKSRKDLIYKITDDLFKRTE